MKSFNFSCALLLAVAAGAHAADCPFGFEDEPGYGCYLYTRNMYLTYDEAVEYCESQNGYIVSHHLR